MNPRRYLRPRWFYSTLGALSEKHLGRNPWRHLSHNVDSVLQLRALNQDFSNTNSTCMWDSAQINRMPTEGLPLRVGISTLIYPLLKLGIHLQPSYAICPKPVFFPPTLVEKLGKAFTDVPKFVLRQGSKSQNSTYPPSSSPQHGRFRVSFLPSKRSPNVDNPLMCRYPRIGVSNWNGRVKSWTLSSFEFHHSKSFDPNFIGFLP
ncbi:hypothetical protein AVEN_266603-1 [Araneus ventricosus]|uniref:Uncharacterized protein n=1 Tax=Araneus ventricosus TaxID=182803 RepID=A0A4Y2TC62_ARAVE|nr:hypothetical protein AVEN_266603-1 [Araneus ventricosus]